MLFRACRAFTLAEYVSVAVGNIMLFPASRAIGMLFLDAN